jgi:ornithine cyclodeaminase
LTIFGTGPQATAHLRAMTREREFSDIRVVGRNREAARALAAQHAGARPMPAAEAMRGTHVVVTATNSTSALFPTTAVEPGTHIAMVGSGSAGASEVEPQLLGRAAAIRVDHRPTCLEESGEIVGALRAGLIDEAAVRELGEVVLGLASGRTSPDDITIYKSVGNGTQDAALAALLLGIVARP